MLSVYGNAFHVFELPIVCREDFLWICCDIENSNIFISSTFSALKFKIEIQIVAVAPRISQRLHLADNCWGTFWDTFWNPFFTLVFTFFFDTFCDTFLEHLFIFVGHYFWDTFFTGHFLGHVFGNVFVKKINTFLGHFLGTFVLHFFRHFFGTHLGAVAMFTAPFVPFSSSLAKVNFYFDFDHGDGKYIWKVI